MIGNRPAVQITDSRDKANPGEIPPVDTSWIWKITAIITSAVFVAYILWQVRSYYTWVYQVSLSDNERNFALVMTHITTLVPVFIIVALAITAIRFMNAKTKRESLVNLYQTQGTIDMLKNPQFLQQLAIQLMDVERTRAATVVAPQALNWQPTDNHSATSNNKETNANIDATKANEVVNADLSIQTLFKKGFIKEVIEK